MLVPLNAGKVTIVPSGRLDVHLLRGGTSLRTILTTLLFFILSYSCLFAVTIAVPKDYPTIQTAINAATDGDEIVVSPGTYFEILQMSGRDFVLRSCDPTSLTVVNATVIDAEGRGTAVTFAGTETTTCVLDGLTITHGVNGIWGKWTHATIQNCVVASNYSNTVGGGIAGCSGLILRNIITGNFVTIGGGAGLAFCDGLIENNIISDNVSLGYYPGGGLKSCNGIIRNNIISGNASAVGGDGLASCTGLIEGNLVVRNRGGSTAIVGTSNLRNNTIWGNAGFALLNCDGIITNCIIWGNQLSDNIQITTPTFSCIEGWTGGGIGNISSDPMFADPETWNFQLLAGSPCIDAGNPDPAFDDALLPPGLGTSRNDMGATGGPANGRWLPFRSPEIKDQILGFDALGPEEIPYADQVKDTSINVGDLIFFINKGL